MNIVRLRVGVLVVVMWTFSSIPLAVLAAPPDDPAGPSDAASTDRDGTFVAQPWYQTAAPMPSLASAQTPSRTLASDETWSGEVYLSEGIIVPEGIELTILPGTTVRVRTDSTQDSRIGFEVYGSLVAVGTRSNRIEITGDNPGASTNQDRWNNIRISGRAEFQYCNISDGYDTFVLSGQVDSFHVSQCEFTNNHNFTIVFYNSNQLVGEISYNVFRGNHTAIGDIAGGYSGNQGNALLIKRNLFYDNSNDAIRWWGRSKPTIVNNTISSGYWAMLFSGLETSDAIVKNNIIYGQNYGIVLTSSPSEGVVSEFPQISYNNFYNCSAGCYVADADPSNGYDFQPFAPSSGAGEISEDPLFVDYANADYHLSANSPSIDAGDPASPYDPDGTIADMGAYATTTPVPIPALSQWGTIAMAALFIAFLGWRLKKRPWLPQSKDGEVQRC